MPNSGNYDLARLPYRVNEWDRDFFKYLKYELEAGYGKPVILCGDLNVAHEPIDIYDRNKYKRLSGYTPEERQSFGNFLKESGFVDTWRHQNPSKIEYSFWN